MAEQTIFISWGMAPVGREMQGLQVFQTSMQHFAGLKEQGTLSDFRVALAKQGNVTHFGGYMVLEGTSANIQQVLNSDDFQDIVTRAAHIVTDLQIVPCDGDERIPARMERLVGIRRELGIDK